MYELTMGVEDMTLPAVTISKSDRERLISAATMALRSERPMLAASMLLREVGRATLVERKALPKDVVTLHSEVKIRDNVNNMVRPLRLVPPDHLTDDPNAVSILTPLGAALIGLSKGDTISWCTATGDRRSVTVLRVSRPPAGEDSA